MAIPIRFAAFSKAGTLLSAVFITVLLTGFSSVVVSPTAEASEKPLLLQFPNDLGPVQNSRVVIEASIPPQIDRIAGDSFKLLDQKNIKRDPKTFFFSPVAPGKVRFEIPLRLGPGRYKIALRGYSNAEENDSNESHTYTSAFTVENKDLGMRESLALNPTEKFLRPVTGEQKSLILLINHADNRAKPVDKKTVESVAFGSAPSFKDFYAKVSRGKISISGDVAGWFQAGSGCPTYGEGADYGRRLADEADAQAQQAGIKLENYNRFFYVFPMDGCNVYPGWGGPAKDSSGKTRTFLGLADSDAGKLSQEGQERHNFLHGFIHEFAHNIGLMHANGKACEANAKINELNLSKNEEYGDQFSSAMGGGNGEIPHLLNAPNLIALGWIEKSEVIEFSQDGVIELAPLYSNSKLPKVLKIPRSYEKPEYIYVSYKDVREPYDKDNSNRNYTANPYGRGAGLHLWTEQFFEPSFGIRPLGESERAHALTDGLSFFDSESRVRVSQISHDQNSLKIAVVRQKNDCEEHKPFIQVQYRHPLNGWLTEGPIDVNPLYASKSFRVVVFNQDSNKCESSEFFIRSKLSGGASSLNSGTSVKLEPQKVLVLTESLRMNEGVRANTAVLEYEIVRVSKSRGSSDLDKGQASAQVSIRADVPGVLEAPRDLAWSTSGGAITLKWARQRLPKAGLFYKVTRYSKNSFSGKSFFVPATNLSFTDTETERGGEYNYEVVLQEGDFQFSALSSEPVRESVRLTN